MIIQIAKKEIHHNLYSIRFPALMVIVAILFILNGFLAVTEPVEEIPRSRPGTYWTRVYKQTGRLQFCVRDVDTDKIPAVLLRVDRRLWFDMMKGSSMRSPTGEHLAKYALPQVDDIDWMFIIKIVFSLFAIIFTFDAICWERANGTLTLMFSNPVSRSSVLLGKYLGACGTLLVPLVMGLILNLLIISAIGGTASLQTEHWFQMGLLVLASIVYISLFVFLGLLISAFVNRPSTSLLILLMLWIALVVIYPNLSVIVARSAWKVETGYENRYARGKGAYNPGVELRKRIRDGRIRTQKEFKRAAEEIYRYNNKIDDNAKSRYQNALIERCRNARRMTMVSPTAVFQYLGEAIADAGFERQQRFLRAAESFHSVFEDYVRSKLGKLSSIPPSNSISEDVTIDGKEITFHAGPPIYKGDLSDFPHFSEPEWSVIDSLRSSLSNLFVLFLWNAILFIMAHYVFVKRGLR